jgi:lipid-A-disaccharide synthase
LSNKLLIIAGEASGDMHGANLIEELKILNPKLQFYGIGGDRMIGSGLNTIYHIKKMAFLGFVEVLRHLPFIKKVQRDLIQLVNKENISTAVLIDYPGFNLDIAKKLKPLGLKVYYYISPQVWAWGKGRVKKIKALVDKMIVVFPFEKEFYDKYNINVEYVGHPLIEQITSYKFLSKEELINKFSLNPEKEILLLMPGSRKHEIKKIFPHSINAAEKLAKEFQVQIVVACAENIDEKIFSTLTSSVNFTVIKGNRYDLLKHSLFGIIKSGTSTLEAGIFQLPFIVVYSSNRLTYILGKFLVGIKNIAMANILLGETVVQELIQNQVNANNIYLTCKSILKDPSKIESIKIKLGSIKNKLGEFGASKKAAQIIYTQLNEA